MISYCIFLVTKIVLKEIKHKKIVQKLFSKYIRCKYQLSLQYYTKDYKDEHENLEKLKFLVEGLKLLPNNLDQLILYLSCNELGRNEDNIRFLEVVV